MAESSPLQAAFARKHPAELAALLAAGPREQLTAALHRLPADAGAAVIAKLPQNLSARLLAGEADEVVGRWLAQAALDDALTLVMGVAKERRERLLAGLPGRRLRRTLEQLVIYPKKTVGALVNPTAVRIAAGTRLHEAVAMLRAGEHAELNWIWVVDEQGRYAGLLDLGKALLTRASEVPVSEIAVRPEPLRAEISLPAARDLEDWLRYPELPVIDYQGHLLGALSRLRLMDALRQETAREHGLIDAVGSLVQAYFRVLGLCLGSLLGMQERR